MANKLLTIPECDLGFVELNAAKSPTILYIHMALGSPVEMSLVTPYLDGYHILIPALHVNIKSQTPRPSFTTSRICSQLATLVQQRAKNGQAHVYGHSMGAHLALSLAMSYPDLMPTVIASGLGISSNSPWWKRAGMPSFIYLQTVLPRMVLSKQKQVEVFNYSIRPASDTIMADILSQPLEGDWSSCKEISASMRETFAAGKSIKIKARALIIAGTATIGDTVDDVKYIVNEIRKTGGEATGVEIKQGGHPWILQLPELCAEINKAWIEGRELPQGASIVL